MCGIAGLIGSKADAATVQRIADQQRHRGPDDIGVWCEEGAALAHTRLSILDLSAAGHQPMHLGPLTIVYNGEIYNFRELRARLPGRSCPIPIPRFCCTCTGSTATAASNTCRAGRVRDLGQRSPRRSPRATTWASSRFTTA